MLAGRTSEMTMATKDEWVDPEEFDRTADELRTEKGGDIKKLNANIIATRMGRKKANTTFYRLFDDWRHRRRLLSHLPVFVLQETYRARLEQFGTDLGNDLTAEADRLAGFRVSELQEQVEGLRRDRDDLLTILDERDASITEATQKTAELHVEISSLRTVIAEQLALIAQQDGRISELQQNRNLNIDPASVATLNKLLGEIAKNGAVSKSARFAPQSGNSTEPHNTCE